MNVTSDHFTLNRMHLESLLKDTCGTEIQKVFQEPWFSEIAPYAFLMAGCDQGQVAHLEGDVAIHTGIVFDKMDQIALKRLNRPANFVERFGAVLHDAWKPATRVELGDGRVSFPGHEALAADAVPMIAQRLQLTDEESARLEFMIRYHGDAHRWPRLPEELKKRLRASLFFQSLALLQEADALSCTLPGSLHLPVHWSEMMRSSKSPTRESRNSSTT